MSQNYSIDRDLKVIAKMGDTFNHYVLSDMLYMSVEGGIFSSVNMPQLTIGAFLLRLRRLNQLRDALNSSQEATLDKALSQYDAVRKEWTLHYEEKMEREAQSRLKAMSNFFRECRENIKTCSSAYLVEASRRTIIEELVIALDEQRVESAHLKSRIQHTDNELRSWVTTGEFLWSDMLLPLYPQERFWWLYGRPNAD
jgi:hypothetical protein